MAQDDVTVRLQHFIKRNQHKDVNNLLDEDPIVVLEKNITDEGPTIKREMDDLPSKDSKVDRGSAGRLLYC